MSPHESPGQMTTTQLKMWKTSGILLYVFINRLHSCSPESRSWSLLSSLCPSSLAPPSSQLHWGIWRKSSPGSLGGKTLLHGWFPSQNTQPGPHPRWRTESQTLEQNAASHPGTDMRARRCRHAPQTPLRWPAARCESGGQTRGPANPASGCSGAEKCSWACPWPWRRWR